MDEKEKPKCLACFYREAVKPGTYFNHTCGRENKHLDKEFMKKNIEALTKKTFLRD